ncbi:MAG: winged helix-turn-helix domain-containing protein [Proteobacteria bacterium]|nr:winged helix-turn-helix domain-containing protein [Pseudomonadota bacterium]
MTEYKFFTADADTKPDHPKLMLATIEAIKNLGGEGKGDAILACVIADYKVSKEEQQLSLRKDQRTKLDYYLGVARQYLKHSGDLGSPINSRWSLTESGSKISTLQDAKNAHDRYKEAYKIHLQKLKKQKKTTT